MLKSRWSSLPTWGCLSSQAHNRLPKSKMPSLPIIFLLCLGIFAHAATVTYDFTVSWVTANPDGMQPRPVMGINGQWPIPWITANVGDRVIVNLNNQLGNATTSLHFHGLYHNGTTQMDGVPGGTQCAIGIGESFTYNFTVSLQCLRPQAFYRY